MSTHIYTSGLGAREFHSTLAHMGRDIAQIEQAFLTTGDEYESHHSFFYVESKPQHDYAYKGDNNDGVCQS